MSNYKRIYIPRATYFFTVVTYNRIPLFAAPGHVALLREAFQYVKQRRPFCVHAAVVLPDHIHCIWNMGNDADYSLRWQMIKTQFSRTMRTVNPAWKRQILWQPRFWEHVIRDDHDLRSHLDYIHYNPVKHGLAIRPLDWEFSSIRKYVELGLYDENWGLTEPESITGLEFE
jgi:putative transposase